MGEEEHNKEESTEDISISEDNSKHEAEQTKEEVSEKQSFSDDAQKSSISEILAFQLFSLFDIYLLLSLLLL